MKRYQLKVTVQVPNEKIPIADDQELLLFQSVRELLINCSKYAGIPEAWVSAKVDTDKLVSEVIDKEGFALDANRPANAPTELLSKFGLFGIRERMHALGGSFQITSSPGHGTTAVLRLPLSVAEASLGASSA